MKKYYKIILSIVLFLTVGVQNKSFAQTTKIGITSYTSCLSVSAKPTVFDSSCNSVYWVISNSTTTIATVKGTNLTYTFSSPGTYQMCMKFANTCKKWDTTICQSVKVDTCPCSFTPSLTITNDTAICGKVYFMAYPANTASNGKYTYTINFGDGTSSATTRDGNHTYSKNGTYKICASVKFTNTAGNSCTKEVCKTITVSCSSKKCTWTSPGFSTTNTCNAYRFEASNQNDTCVTYYWLIDSSTKAMGRIFETKFKTKGYHKVCLIYYNKCKGCDTTICSYVNVTCIHNCNWSKATVNYKATSSTSYTFEASNLNDTCVSYTFIVGNKVISSNRLNTYTFTTNGSYAVGYRFYNKCTGCDTIIWTKISISSYTSKCNWPTGLGFTTKLATCPYIVMTANKTSDSCITYKCFVNDSAAPLYGSTGQIFYYKMPKNGTYKICMKISNPCTGCDTTICSSWTTDCIKPTGSCNWGKLSMGYTNSCRKFTFEGTNFNDSCVTYKYTIGGNTGILATLTGRVVSYNFPSNGTYKICFTAMNNCKNCDTTYCTSINVNCSTSSNCKWPTGMGFTTKLVSCPYIVMTVNKTTDSCLTYKCYVNDSAAPLYGTTNQMFYYRMPKNGTYRICMKISNACTGCDTTICSSWTTDCIKSTSCNWGKLSFGYSNICKKYAFEGTLFSDSCTTYKYTISGNNGIITTLTGRLAAFEFPSNGTYKVCFTASNSCKNCDTSMCKSIVVNCNTTNKCTWNSPSFSFSKSSVDSCNYTFEAKNMNNLCITYKWYIGDTNNTNILNGRLVQNKFGSSGVQHVYLMLYDTCNKCDTFIHREMKTNCYGVGLNNVNKTNIQIIPNPAHSQFEIVTNGNATGVVIDQTGRIVTTLKIDNNQNTTINCINWSDGIYFIQLNTNGKLERMKFIKN